MIHEELKQKVFSLTKNLEGVYAIEVNIKTLSGFPRWIETTEYEAYLRFEPWVRSHITVKSFTPEMLIRQLEEAISQPTNAVIEQLNSIGKLF